MQNDNSKKLLKNIKNEYNASDICSKVKCKRFLPKKSRKQNEFSG